MPKDNIRITLLNDCLEEIEKIADNSTKNKDFTYN